VKRVIEHIERTKAEVAEHPFYRWLASDQAPLEDRFAFAPVFVTFIMGFSDMNRWFMRYPAAGDELRRAINKHTFEDATHSRLFLEDWRKLGLDGRLGWSAGDTIAWHYASRETEIFRGYGMEVMKMCALHEDPLVRFSFMDAIEACGHVFFAATSNVATELSKKTGEDYRYFGTYHLKRETGHLLAGWRAFEEATLDEARLEEACSLVDRIFGMFLVENDRLLRYAERVSGDLRGEAPRPLAASGALDPREPLSSPPSSGGGGAGGAGAGEERASGPASPSQRAVQGALALRKKKASGHPLFAWMQAGDPKEALRKLRRLAAFWVPDILGYRDLATYALAYPRPEGARERAINRVAMRLASHHRLFLRDWVELDMDQALGFSASDTLDFYCVSESTEVQRKSMATFVKLAFKHPDPRLRFWLIEALEASGEAFFRGTRALSRRVEADGRRRLDYLADRHASAHPRLEPDEEADRVAIIREELGEREREIAVEIIDAVFDCLEAQLSVCLELVTSGELAFG
jgi:hypothetical protein